MLYKTHSEEREALQKEINDLSDQLKRSEMQKSHAQELHKVSIRPVYETAY